PERRATSARRTVDVVLHAVVPGVLVPPTVMLAIVVAFLVPLLVATVAIVVNHFAIVNHTPGQGQNQRRHYESAVRKPVWDSHVMNLRVSLMAFSRPFGWRSRRRQPAEGAVRGRLQGARAIGFT